MSQVGQRQRWRQQEDGDSNRNGSSFDVVCAAGFGITSTLPSLKGVPGATATNFGQRRIGYRLENGSPDSLVSSNVKVQLAHTDATERTQGTSASLRQGLLDQDAKEQNTLARSLTIAATAVEEPSQYRQGNRKRNPYFQDPTHFCVRARAAADPHYRLPEAEKGNPIVMCDYAFLQPRLQDKPGSDLLMCHPERP
eukprot:6122449-Amphidinium_carterae.5